jgi:pilus assembly protein CpaE
VLRYLGQLYAYVIVDSSHYLNDVTLAVMDIADTIILVATQEIPSIKNDNLFLDLLLTMNIPANKVSLVMNKFDKRIAIAPEIVGKNLKQEVLAIIPLDERTVIPAANRGIPFMLDNKAQPASRGIYTLAEGLRAKLIKREMEQAETVAKR